MPSTVPNKGATEWRSPAPVQSNKVHSEYFSRRPSSAANVGSSRIQFTMGSPVSHNAASEWKAPAPVRANNILSRQTSGQTYNPTSYRRAQTLSNAAGPSNINFVMGSAAASGHSSQGVSSPSHGHIRTNSPSSYSFHQPTLTSDRYRTHRSEKLTQPEPSHYVPETPYSGDSRDSVSGNTFIAVPDQDYKDFGSAVRTADSTGTFSMGGHAVYDRSSVSDYPFHDIPLEDNTQFNTSPLTHSFQSGPVSTSAMSSSFETVPSGSHYYMQNQPAGVSYRHESPVEYVSHDSSY